MDPPLWILPWTSTGPPLHLPRISRRLISLLASVGRALNGGFERKILLCWGADAFIVVVGAPVGALVLTPSAAHMLRRLFYVMAVAQFVNFTFMEEAFYDRRVAPFVGTRVYLVLVPLLVAEVGLLALHYRRLVQRGELAVWGALRNGANGFASPRDSLSML